MYNIRKLRTSKTLTHWKSEQKTSEMLYKKIRKLPMPGGVYRYDDSNQQLYFTLAVYNFVTDSLKKWKMSSSKKLCYVPIRFQLYGS